MKLWCHNAKTGEIFSYEQSGEVTDFPRGTFLVYWDYLTTGLKSKQEAEKWSKKYFACEKCKASRPRTSAGKCLFCDSKLEEAKVEQV